MTTYTIATYQPSPSMNQDTVQIETESYQEAVQKTKESWIKTGRYTTLHSGKYAVYYWHRIDDLGEFVDRNKNSGVPSSGRYTR